MANPLIWIDEETQAETAPARPGPFVFKTAGETMPALGQIDTFGEGPLFTMADIYVDGGATLHA